MVQTVPHTPQFRASLARSWQRPPQPPWPAGQQSDPEHEVPAPQAVPHAPQFALLLRVSTQAVPQRVSSVEQFARHCPATHPVPAPQVVPQAPQFVLSVWVFAHALPQRVVPAAQGARHRPLMQLVPAPQTVPQAPQFASSLWVFTHAVPQPVRPPVQVGVPVHAPAAHDCPGRQARPQPPQWAVEVWVFTQVMPHPVCPPVHTSEQVPAEHESPPVQALLQRPQWAAEERVSTSHPLAASPSQLAKPALQAKPQAPAAQVGVALARAGQALLQAPQWAVDVRVSTSQPFAALPSQFAKPMEHPVLPHTPATHVALAPVGTGHTRPHEPQWALLSWVFTHAPLQHDCPEGHGLVDEHPLRQRPALQT